MTKLKFEELGLSEEILNAVRDMGFEEASPIQSESIPFIAEGKDIIGQAQTGTGKTAAFAIPVIEKLDPEVKEIQALILCPTRELVIQVSEEFRKIMKYKQNLYIAPVYGGQEIERQLRTLKKGVQVVIGTPGRIMDHMRRGSIKTDSVRIAVLDEADEMLDMGFRGDIEIILKDTPETRQTVMFSATMADDIIQLTKQYQKAPVIINVTNKKLNAPKINQVYFEIQEKNKPEVLARLLDIHDIKLALVFCNTKSQVDQLVEILKTRGYFADALHGDMNQNQRDKVMNGFRNGVVEILVATDVAGRGIDVNDIEAVFNYDLPRDDEDYIHRIGRTARAGKSGTAYSFVTGKQIYNLTRIQKMNNFQITRGSIPTIDEIETAKINNYASKIAEIVEAGHLSKYVNQVETLMGDDYTSIDIAASLLKIIIEKDNENYDQNANFEMPLADSRSSRNNRDSNFRNKRGSGNKDAYERRISEKNKKTTGKYEFREKDAKPYNSSRKRTDEYSEKTKAAEALENFEKEQSGRPDKPFRKFDGENKRSYKKREDRPFKSENSFKRDDEKQNDRKSDEKNFGDKKFGDKKFGDKKFGDKKFGDKKFGDKKFGDKKFGDKKFGDKNFRKKK